MEHLTTKSLNLSKPQAVFVAIQFAKDVLRIFEDKYPKDMRPRKAIEAAEAWLKDPSEENANAANAAAAYAAANAYAAADSAAAAAAAAANTSAYSAANASAYSAASCAAAAAYSAAAANAAYIAAAAANDKQQYIHNKLVELLPDIIKYKLQEGGPPFKVDILGYLDNEDKETILYHLDLFA